MIENKILESKAIVRFQDCDPFNHLNNAAYLNYLVNAREDQLIEAYGINIYDTASLGGKSWVVSSNQIAYLRPAWLMESLVMQSQLLSFDDTETLVELRMYDKDKAQLKALMWSTYVHIDLTTQKRTPHSKTLMELFDLALAPVIESHFEARAASFKNLKKPKK
jgi:YbgC/YbaW family acyl-CoA thioester hydrolase